MIDCYTWTTDNGYKPRMMLEETGLAHRIVPVNLREQAQMSPQFMKISPGHKIPAIVDDDGPGGARVTLCESGAILKYLAEKSGKFLPTDMAKKYEVLQWLMIQLTSVGPMFGQFTHFKLFSPKDKDTSYAMTRYQTEVKRLYEVLEQRLAKVPYLGGDEYTIADIATFPWTRNHDMQGVKWEDNPNLARWFNAISERPAVKSALVKIAAITSNRETASEDQKDRFFNRGRYARA